MPKPEKQPQIHRCPKNAIVLEYESQAGGGGGRAVWYARVPSEHSREDVLRPEYFGLMQSENQLGKVMRVGDMIEIEPENARWRLHARVMALRFQSQKAHLRVQQEWDYTVKAPSGFIFTYNGDAAGWAVFKGETELDNGFATEDECLQYANELIGAKAA